MGKRQDTEPEPEVLPVMRWWVDKVLRELERRDREQPSGRGAQADLARGIECSTGQLAELLALDDEGLPISKYSRLVSKVDGYFKWPPLMPMSPDANEIRYLIEGLDVDAKELLRELRDMSVEERRAHLTLIRKRKSES